MDEETYFPTLARRKSGSYTVAKKKKKNILDKTRKYNGRSYREEEGINNGYMFLEQWFTKYGPGTRSTASPGNLEMSILRLHFTHTKSAALGVEPSNLCCNKSST